MNYLYPRNLKEEPKLGFWTLKDIGLIGIGGIFGVLILTQFKWNIPLVFVGIYAFLTIRFSDETILNFISYALVYFVLEPQLYEWSSETRDKPKERKKVKKK